MYNIVFLQLLSRLGAETISGIELKPTNLKIKVVTLYLWTIHVSNSGISQPSFSRS